MRVDTFLFSTHEFEGRIEISSLKISDHLLGEISWFHTGVYLDRIFVFFNISLIFLISSRFRAFM